MINTTSCVTEIFQRAAHSTPLISKDSHKDIGYLGTKIGYWTGSILNEFYVSPVIQGPNTPGQNKDLMFHSRLLKLRMHHCIYTPDWLRTTQHSQAMCCMCGLCLRHDNSALVIHPVWDLSEVHRAVDLAFAMSCVQAARSVICVLRAPWHDINTVNLTISQMAQVHIVAWQFNHFTNCPSAYCAWQKCTT